MTFSGRRPNDRAKSIGKGILEGLSALGTAMSDAPKRARIEEIDKTIEELKQERNHLIKDLIEPGDLEVSDDFDPYWRPNPTASLPYTPTGDGRLTKCAGRDSSSRYHRAHPGCPYVEQIHTAHEFTLRD